MTTPALHAVIGVRHVSAATYYVKRSATMENYPGVWSLPSIQYELGALNDILNLDEVRPHFARLSKERFGGVNIDVRKHLTSGICIKNVLNRRVVLHLYEVDFADPRLNPAYYTAGEWLSPEAYAARTAGAACGFCLQLWSDYCVRNKLVGERFAPAPILESTAPESERSERRAR